MLLLTACGATTNTTELSENQKEIYGEKCRCFIIVSKDAVDLDLYEKAAIQVADGSLQVSVFEVSRGQGGQLQSLETHAGLVMGNLEETMEEYKLNSRRRLKVDGMDAVQFSVYREDGQGQKTNDILTFIEGPSQFYQILTWSFPEDFSFNRNRMQEIVQSFRVKK